MKRVYIILILVFALGIVGADIIGNQLIIKDTSFPSKQIQPQLTLQGVVTFNCDGKSMSVNVSAHDVKYGYDDEFENDGGIARKECPTGIISQIRDWNGNTLKEYGDETTGIFRSFNSTKINDFKSGADNQVEFIDDEVYPE